jgi:hypothetical protein
MAPVVVSGVIRAWWESGVRRSDLCWSVWQDCDFSRREDAFTVSLVYKEMP